MPSVRDETAWEGRPTELARHDETAWEGHPPFSQDGKRGGGAQGLR
ncbi:MAG TPA: hypothetical protein VNH11_33325 [Pirellulales bacterium]|nr:hypothetical protein [Pirellulales bacterium]